MQLYDVNFEAVSGDVLSKRPPIVNDAFHLHGTLGDAWRQNFYRGYRREPGYAELVRFIAIAPAYLLLRNRVSSGRKRQLINVVHLILARQIDDALTGANEVLRGLAHRAQTQHAAPAKPPGRGHRRQIGRAVLIET